MIITWFGQSYFKIQGDKSILVTDPFDKNIGLKAPRSAADIVAISHGQTDPSQLVKGLTSPEPFTINEPGEYEVKGTFIYGVASTENGTQNNVAYRIEMDLITIGYLGAINRQLTSKEVEKFEGVDILIIPVGGRDSIDAKKAGEIISQLEPRIVIPMRYKLKGLKANFDSLDQFCKEIGVCPTDTVPKLKITKKDLPAEEMKIIIMQP